MKTCTKCGRSEHEVSFEPQRRQCCECRSEYMKEYLRNYGPKYYRANKAEVNHKVVKINKQRRHERYALIQQMKEGAPCLDCGKKFPSPVMDYDHRDPSTKRDNISVLVRRMVQWPRILEEIAKCDLVCTNCHRLRTYKGQNCYKTRRYEHHRLCLDQLKSTTSCLDCGRIYKACQMDFDHVGLQKKKANVAQVMARSTHELLAEVGKCHLVCANCHRIRSYTGVRKHNPSHSMSLVLVLQRLLTEIPFPEDQRFVPFPSPELLGVVPDKKLAVRYNISLAMVAWYRRKAGISSPLKIEPWHSFAGTDSDSAIANRFKICHRTVWRYRSLNGIPSFRQQRKQVAA